MDLEKFCRRIIKHLNYGKNYIERLEYELGIIKKKGLGNYFIILFDISKVMRKRKVTRGFGCGIANSSLVLFLTGVTFIDPVKFDLNFDNYINIDKSGLPDFEISICMRMKFYMYRILKEIYGRNNVASLSSIEKLKGRFKICIKPVPHVSGLIYFSGKTG